MERPSIPSDLLDRLRSDPARTVEHLALYAADLHGPAAAAWIADMKRQYVLDQRELAARAKRKHAALARFGGAATGFGGLVTVLPDLVALAWIQSRLVFFTAAAYGYDPEDPMRPAELLVLRDFYANPAEARQALDGTGTMALRSYVHRRIDRGADRTVVNQLLRFAGKRAGRKIAGKMIPGFAVLFNAVTNERDTRQLADRAMAFYGGEDRPAISR